MEVILEDIYDLVYKQSSTILWQLYGEIAESTGQMKVNVLPVNWRYYMASPATDPHIN